MGGVPLNFGISARLGKASLKDAKGAKGEIFRAPFVIEADEYDTAFFDKRSKFVHYRPRTAILNNLEFDHADIFDNLGAIERQFHHLVRTVPASGRLVVNADADSLQRVLDMGHWSDVAQFGVGHGNASPAHPLWSIDGPPDNFAVVHQGKALACVRWDITGVHNQLNALAAIIAAEHIGVSVPQAAEALASFQNVRRRMEVRGTVERSGGAITVYDDFAHHPTAIRTTLDGLRRKVGPHARILAVFEPRSNTMKLGTMKAALPEDKLAATWTALTTQAGAFKGVTETRTEARGVLTVAVVACQFERAVLDLNVVYNPAGQVGGFSVRPHTAPAPPWSAPDYVTAAAFKETDVMVGGPEWPLPGTWKREFNHLRPPVDNRLKGSSSWRNLLTRRDRWTPAGWRADNLPVVK